MCQSVAEGGRRCPSHRYDTKNVIDSVRAEEGNGGYSQSLYHAAFLDLRRENRGVELTPDLISVAQNRVELVNSDSDRPHDSHPSDNETVVSQGTLLLKGVVDQNSDAVIIAAVNTGDDQVSRKVFSYVYDHIDDYETPTPEQLQHARDSLDTQTWGLRTGRLLRDPKAIQALAIFQSGVLHDLDPRITPPTENVSRITGLERVMSPNSPVVSVGFDPASSSQNSRLEMILRDDLDTRLVYQNVTEEQFQAIQRGGRGAAATVEAIRLNPNCRYESSEDAEQGALTENRSSNAEQCTNCGQFVGNIPHSCPALVLRNDLYRLANTAAPVEVEHEEIPTDLVIEETLVPATTEPLEAATGTTVEEVPLTSSHPSPGVFALPQTPEEMVYPTPENMLTNMQYEEVTPALVISGSRINRMRVSSLTDTRREEFIQNGGMPRNLAENTVVLYQYQSLSGNPAENTSDGYRFLEAIPNHEARGMIINGARVFRRPTGKVLEGGRTWEDEYGVIPTDTDGTLIEQNTSASTTLAPVDSTTRLFTSRPYDYYGSDPQPLEVGRSIERGGRDRWKFGNARSLRRALEAGETAIVPFEHSFAGGYDSGQGFVDAQGWEVTPPRRSYAGNPVEISGTVALRKNANGIVEVVGVDSLHCSRCSNSNCTHIGYSVRQTAYIGQSIITPRDDGSPRNARRTVNPNTGLPVSLENICTVTRDEEGRRTVSINLPSEQARRRTDHRILSSRLAVPLTDENSTDHLYGLNTYAPNATHLTRALRNIEEGESLVVPMNVLFTARRRASLNSAYLNTRPIVNGNVTYGRDNEGNPFVRERSLRCTCDVYARNYSCRHTRQVEAGELGLFADTETQQAVDNLNYLNLDRSALALTANIVAVQDREALDGRELSLEEAEVLAITEQDLSYEEQTAIRTRRERELREQARLEAREAELRALAGYAEQREKMRERFNNFSGTRYSEDFEAFKDEVASVKAQLDQGETPHALVVGSVLGGIGDDDPSARKFGVEIEVVFPGGSTAYKKNAVARALHQAGLTDTGEVGYYHTGRSNGWVKWTAENDSTVDLEIVSPLMKDTPEDWAQLQKVCEIVKAHGGEVNHQTGSHVHMSTGDYGSSIPAHAALIDEFSRYEDVLYRLGSNPETKTHRGTSWCIPNVVAAGSEVSGSQQRVSSYLNSHHSSAVNLSACGGGAKSHAEVRIWDGSLSPAHIQMQVMLTAAMTEVASQRVTHEEDGTFTFSASEDQMKLGSSKRKRFESEEEETAKFREMLDRYFPDEARRRQLIALWVTNNKWQDAA